MNRGLITVAAVLLTFGATAAQAHDPVAQRVDWLSERLELTEEQQAEVQGIYAEEQEQRKALMAEQKEMRKAMVEQRKAMREKSKSIREASREQLSGVLTEEQSARLAEMREGMQKRAIMRRGMDGRRGMDRNRGWDRRREAVERMFRQRQMKKSAEAPSAEE